MSNPKSLQSVWLVRQPCLNFRRYNVDVYLLFTHVSSFITLYHLTLHEVVDLRRFMGALKVQGLSRDSLPYKAPFQPFGSWFALISTGIITIFKGEYLFTSLLMSFKEHSQNV